MWSHVFGWLVCPLCTAPAMLNAVGVTEVEVGWRFFCHTMFPISYIAGWKGNSLWSLWSYFSIVSLFLHTSRFCGHATAFTYFFYLDIQSFQTGIVNKIRH